MLAGARGRAVRLAMEVVVRAARVLGAPFLIEASMAHIGSCFYSGQAGLDFAEFLLEERARFAVPTMTNVGLVDLLHPDLRPAHAAPEEIEGARRLMEIYEALGCDVVWTCAPYQSLRRPAIEDQIIGSESNAVVFYNSVIGARTNKYGDFLDVCAALTGRVPAAGLHTDEGRRGAVVFDCGALPATLLDLDVTHHLLGLVVGQRTGACVPVLTGLPHGVTEDQLKAFGAAAAAAGAVEMFHAVGVTPEAPTLDTACGGSAPEQIEAINPSEVLRARRTLLGAPSDSPIGAVCLGTPHYSVSEFERLLELLAGRRIHRDVNLLVSTSRAVLAELELRGWRTELETAGTSVIVDTCTYYTPRVAGIDGPVVTDSAKWAYYGRGMHDSPVTFATTGECVESAVSGRLIEDHGLWGAAEWSDT